MTAVPGTVLAILASAEGGMSPVQKLLSPYPGLALWTLVVFLLLFFVLRKFGFGKLVEMLDARDKALRGAIEEAKKAKADAESSLAQQKELLDNARREAAQIVSQAQEQAAREAARKLAEAREEYEKTVARGRAQIEQETRAALAQVRQATASLAIDVASKLIHRNLDQPAQRELAEQFVKDLETM